MPVPQPTSAVLSGLQAQLASRFGGPPPPPVPAVTVETPEQVAERLAAQDLPWRRVFEDQVPMAYAGARLDRLKPQQDPERMVTDFLDSDRSTLVLLGPSRRGKSTAAYAIGYAARARRLSVYATSAVALSQMLWTERNETREDSTERRSTLRTALSIDVLIVDDLGREKPDRWGTWTEHLWQIAETRFARGLRTVITRNANVLDGGAEVSQRAAVAKLVDAYTTPIIHRFLDTGWAAWVDGEVLVDDWVPAVGRR